MVSQVYLLPSVSIFFRTILYSSDTHYMDDRGNGVAGVFLATCCHFFVSSEKIDRDVGRDNRKDGKEYE